MSEKRNTVDFGAHVFRVEIPAARTGEIWIIEDYGYRGGEAGIPRQEARAVLERRVRSQIAEAAQRDFNARLKAAGLKSGRWRDLLDRMLGRELCVLAWAAEKATDDELPVVASKWAHCGRRSAGGSSSRPLPRPDVPMTTSAAGGGRCARRWPTPAPA